MNLGQIKTKAIQIIRAYSNGGSLVGSGENADYLLSMNGFINDAQFEIAKIRPIKKKIPFSAANETTENYYKYNLPSDVKDIVSVKADDVLIPYEIEVNQLLIPRDNKEIINVLCNKYPVVIDNTTKDDAELEVDLDCQMILAYYAAGHVMIDENPSLSEFFLDEYEKKKQNIPNKNTQKRVTQVRGD